MKESQKRYLEEYEKYKDVKISIGPCQHKTEHIDYEIVEINEEEQWVIVKTTKSGFTKKRTLHWCRKNLVFTKSMFRGQLYTDWNPNPIEENQ